MAWQLFGGRKWPDLSMDEVRKRAKILVIDDMEFTYLPLFAKDGYTFEKWNDVDDLPKLESGYYDIILLDIQGVGAAQSHHEQGLGVLRHLRQTCPAQIVIAYSNADFSLKYHEFFKLADRTLAKTADYVEFKRTVDQLLAQRFSIGFYIDRVLKIASPYVADANRLRDLTSSAILRGKKRRLTTYLSEHVDSKEAISMILQVVEVGLAIAAL